MRIGTRFTKKYLILKNGIAAINYNQKRLP